MEPISILLTTKGHPFDKGSFFQLFDSFENVEYTHVEHPAAQLILNPLNAKDYSVLVFYDMPGIDFHENHPGKEIAQLINLLISEDSNYMTGEVLQVSGADWI